MHMLSAVHTRNSVQSTGAVLTTPPVSRTISPSITPSWPYAEDASSASSPIATSCSSLSPVATKSSSSGAAVTDSAMFLLVLLLSTRPCAGAQGSSVSSRASPQPKVAQI